jgi:ATP-binding cassette, subfamily C, bacterial CydC
VSSGVARLLATERGRLRPTLRWACVCAAVAGAASVALLGLSGWFIASAAAAGAAGLVAAQAFNYLLPSAAIRLLAIARTGSRYGERLFGHEAALLALARVRPALFRAAALSTPARALALTAGEATASMIQDIQALETSWVHRAAPWAAGAASVTGSALLGCAGWAPLASTWLCLLALTVGAGLLARRMPAAAAKVRVATGALKEGLAMLAGAEGELRCYGLEARAGDELDRATRALEAAQRRYVVLASGFDLLCVIATGLAAGAALWLARHDGAALTALAALAAAVTLEGTASLLRRLAQRGAAEDAADRVDLILGAQLPPVAPAVPSSARTSAPARAIELRRPINASLRPGARVAVVGRSGVGKTTLLETLLGLRAAEPGAASIDGCDIATLPPDTLRSCFAWLPQDAMLLAGTVRENLLLAHPDSDESSMWRALHDAALDGRIESLPAGLDTWLGADGAGLSGGERRRLALARTYLARAPWLLLDEPTVGLDPALERTVLDRLKARLAETGQGLIAVTHRRAVAMACESVLSLGGDTRSLKLDLAA